MAEHTVEMVFRAGNDSAQHSPVDKEGGVESGANDERSDEDAAVEPGGNQERPDTSADRTKAIGKLQIRCTCRVK